MRVLKSAALYFALVFGAGTFLGLIRVLLLGHLFGAAAARIVEAPFMLVAIMLAARFVSRRHPRSLRRLLVVGVLAFAFMLLALLVVGVTLRGVSPAQALLDRDPVSGVVLYGLMGLFAIAPWVWRQRRHFVTR